MDYKDLKTFISPSNYRVNVSWRHVEHQLENWFEGTPMQALNLNPDFQRAHIWTEEQQKAYIEYILQGGMSGKEIYFNAKGWMCDFSGPFVIVDGKQRLEAVRKFVSNRLAIFNGVYAKNIKGIMPSYCEFVFCVNNLKTQKEVLKWYLEMNTGGTPHTIEEIDKVKKILSDSK